MCVGGGFSQSQSPISKVKYSLEGYVQSSFTSVEGVAINLIQIKLIATPSALVKLFSISSSISL